MKKRFIIGFLGFIGLMGNSFAQNGFNMPYSQFGIGISEQPYNLPMVTRMGGVVQTRSGKNYINPFNPASYGSIQKESFVFDMGAGIQMTTLSDNDKRMKDADGNISYLMVGFPVTDWMKVAGGLMPYSATDYESVAIGTGPGYDTVKNFYNGTGGTSQLFIGSSFNLLGNGLEGRRLQVGFNINYLTGRIERGRSYQFLHTDTTYFMNKYYYKETKISNFLFDLGVQYWEPLGEKYTLGVGLTYKPYRKCNVNDKAVIYTASDTIYPLSGNSPKFTSTVEQDHTIGIGVSLERNKRWLVAADASFAGWSGLKYTEGSSNPILGDDAFQAGPWSRYALGIEKIGSMDASSYWGRISLSLGAHLEQGAMRLYLQGKEQVVNEWGAGLGVTLPMRKGQSLLTLSVEYSRLGNKDLLQRETLTFGISVSTCERWFVKRKYN